MDRTDFLTQISVMGASTQHEFLAQNKFLINLIFKSKWLVKIQ